jgi:hypothetical protein
MNDTPTHHCRSSFSSNSSLPSWPEKKTLAAVAATVARKELARRSERLYSANIRALNCIQ